PLREADAARLEQLLRRARLRAARIVQQHDLGLGARQPGHRRTLGHGSERRALSSCAAVSLFARLFGTNGGRAAGETETGRRIGARLERLAPDRARQLAAFAYVLARVANADLRITDTETDEMQRLVRERAGLSDEEAALAVEIAKSQARLLGGTE